MNSLQESMLTLIKILNPSIFENVLSPEEKIFGEKIRQFQKELRVQNHLPDKTMLTWKSKSGEILACPISDTGFMFSEVGILLTGGYAFIFNYQVLFKDDPKQVELVKIEIEELKSLLANYLNDITNYFN